MSYQEQTTVDQTIAPIRDEKLATHDLYETAAADASLSKFIEVLGPDLELLMKGPDQLTVIAPVNEAFDHARLSGDAAREYVIRSSVLAGDLKMSGTVKTSTGRVLKVTTDNGYVIVSGARLIRTDIGCTNDTLQVADRLLDLENS